MKKDISIIISLLVLIPIVILFIWGYSSQDYFKDSITKKIETYGFIGLFIISALLDFIPQYIPPHAGLISAIVLGFKPPLAVFIAILGSTFGSFIGFELGQYKGVGFVKNLVVSKKFKKVESLLNKKGRLIVSLAAISPIPYVPVILGSLKMSRKNFWTFGVIPRIIGFIAVAIFILWL